jgi:acyl-CoA thioester hydrolase
MPRIQLDLPDVFLFSTEIPIRISDINYGGHIGHDSILSLMHEARVQFYKHAGFKDEVSLDGSIGQIIADAAIVYKSESFLGDVLVIEIALADVTKYGFDMLYKISQKSTGKEVARGKTGIVCFNYATKKIAQVPETVFHRLFKKSGDK